MFSSSVEMLSAVNFRGVWLSTEFGCQRGVWLSKMIFISELAKCANLRATANLLRPSVAHLKMKIQIGAQ
jgi:hypothetical protein